jgi:hypothetical protein
MMARECAGPRGTGKPLHLAVDDVPGTTEATQHPFWHRQITPVAALSRSLQFRCRRALRSIRSSTSEIGWKNDAESA